MLFVAGAANGLGNVTVLTVTQKWAPPALLGRVMSAIMLCAFGGFPLSVAILGGLTQREFREFGMGPREPEGAALPGLRSDEGATREADASRAPGGEWG
jgi:hypothetical protein